MEDLPHSRITQRGKYQLVKLLHSLMPDKVMSAREWKRENNV
jgi:hypothetical protein